MSENRYYTYRQYCNILFGNRAQKISINAGLTCPNRDGTKGWGGCTFCNNSTFNPDYCQPQIGITKQIDRGIEFFSKYKSDTFLAYFQAYSNTYGDTKKLLQLYNEALSHPKISGIVIGTRPDCLATELLQQLADIRREKYVAIELGVESCYNDTLERINRGHTWEESVEAIKQVDKMGIDVGIHLIMGLPAETRQLMLQEATLISELPITFLKLHQLQIVKGSKMAAEYIASPQQFDLFSADEYANFCVDFLEHLAPHIVVERFISQAPREMVIAPFWNIKNFEFVHLVEKLLTQRNTKQGVKYIQTISQ